ncbi:MAG: sensor histidine kinase, partial [Thiobacillus sp.]
AHSRERLRALAAHVETAKEQERLYLAREVHDDLGGNLTTIKIGLSCLARQLPPAQTPLAERVRYLDNLVDQTFDAAHRIASNLRPAALDFGIVAAIDSQLQRFGRNTEIEYTFSAPADDVPLDPAAAIAVFRIVQEGLTNVAKHARATRVRLELVRERDSLRLTLTDNGCGLPVVQNGNARPAFGILGMSERAAALGGDFAVRPAACGGTELALRIPLAPPTARAE